MHQIVWSLQHYDDEGMVLFSPYQHQIVCSLQHYDDESKCTQAKDTPGWSTSHWIGANHAFCHSDDVTGKCIQAKDTPGRNVQLYPEWLPIVRPESGCVPRLEPFTFTLLTSRERVRTKT
jgi:hypothetical protein